MEDQRKKAEAVALDDSTVRLIIIIIATIECTTCMVPSPLLRSCLLRGFCTQELGRWFGRDYQRIETEGGLFPDPRSARYQVHTMVWMVWMFMSRGNI